MTRVLYVVVAPRWRTRWDINVASLVAFGRPLLRWHVLRGTYPDPAVSMWRTAHMSSHWTRRAAERAADRLRKDTTDGQV